MYLFYLYVLLTFLCTFTNAKILINVFYAEFINIKRYEFTLLIWDEFITVNYVFCSQCRKYSLLHMDNYEDFLCNPLVVTQGLCDPFFLYRYFLIVIFMLFNHIISGLNKVWVLKYFYWNSFSITYSK